MGSVFIILGVASVWQQMCRKVCFCMHLEAHTLHLAGAKYIESPLCSSTVCLSTHLGILTCIVG